MLINKVCGKHTIVILYACIMFCFRYMCTSGIDRTMKIWDLRTYKMLQSYKIGMGASHLAFSQKNTLAVSKGNIVEV